MIDEQTHPDPLEDPEGWATYQAEHEDDEATREANARAAVEAEAAPSEPPDLIPREVQPEPPDELHERLQAEDRAREARESR
jgi:hypothetical protein